MSRYLTADDVAEQLHVSPGTVMEWVRAGDFPSVRLHNRFVRFKQQHVDDYMDEHEVPAAVNLGRSRPKRHRRKAS